MDALSGSSPPLQRGTLFEEEGMGLLQFNFMGGGSVLIANSSWEKKITNKFSGPLKEFGFALLSRTVLGLWVCLLLPKKWGWVVNSWAETCLQELQQHFLNFAVNIRLLFIALLFRWSCSLLSYLTRPKPSIFPCIFCSLTLPFNVLLFGVFQLATALLLSC